MLEIVRFDADRGDARLRLDQVLLRHVHHVSRLSRRQTQRWIEAGAVTIDGRVVRRASTRVRAGAGIEVAVPAAAPRRLAPVAEPHPLEIVYEDAWVLVANKPPGMVVHPTYRQPSGTLLNGVLWRLRDRPDLRPGVLTRLDRDTSGLVVVALTPGVHAVMQRDAAAGRIRKEYLAAVRGTPRPRAGRIAEPLARDPLDRRRVVVTPGGAPSETHYDLLASRRADARPGAPHATRRISLVRCTLVTGRTHQIRVHLASRGWPIVGDRTYGEADPRIDRQALHAWRVTLPHPLSRDLVELEAPVPDDFRSLGL